jgi:hypothetical protein
MFTTEILALCLVQLLGAPEREISLEAPRRVACFDAAELVVRVADPPFGNPFTEAVLSGAFRREEAAALEVMGFADSADGSIFRLRFSPGHPGAYRYEVRLRGAGIDRAFSGEISCVPSDRPGPVIPDPEHPRHFIHAGSRRPFYHLGYTAYHLLDPSRDDAAIERTIDYCAEHRFNKIRFLLAGYPRDLDRRSSAEAEYGEGGARDPWKAPNYGAPPGRVNALAAWAGRPHAYDFSRFEVAHWQRADRAVRRMRERGIVATCIFTIEKQDLPKQYGALTEHEYRFYAYAAARLSAFDNVWWDLGNEHNEYRDTAWGETMGAFLKKQDPYGRLASAHAYKDFLYPRSAWADFIITQQYGDEKEVHDWVLEHRALAKPYINEEYGYEGEADEPGQNMNADWTRRCHWSIALAGGYATYGDWSKGVSWYYMGEPGPGKAAVQLKHLRAFFEALPFRELEPRADLVAAASGGAAFCLALPPAHHVFYLPRGGEAAIELSGNGGSFSGRWFDPRTGAWRDGPELEPGKNTIEAPAAGDWVLHVRGMR